MKPRNIEVIDRRRAAVHEAGHIAAARYIRRNGDPWGRIWHGVHYDDSDKSPQWIGSTQTMAHHETLRDQRLVGVAGAVAEAVWNSFCYEGVPDLGDIYADLSETDRVLYKPDDMRYAKTFDLDKATRREVIAWQNAVKRAHHLFDRNGGLLWRSLYRTAHRLIVESRAELKAAA